MPGRIVMNLGMYIVPPEATAAEHGVRVSSNIKTATSQIILCYVIMHTS
jgi:hypothetical protein